MTVSQTKGAFNITTWPQLQINYWGIPKSANTSIKCALLQKSGVDIVSLDNEAVHGTNVCSYIDRHTALRNGFQNVSVIRHPYQRTISLWKDFGLARSSLTKKFPIDQDHVADPDYFFLKAIHIMSDDQNIHFRSHASLLCDGNYVVVDQFWYLEKLQDFFRKFDLKEVVRNSSIPSLKIDLTLEHKLSIIRRYKQDFEIFGFEL